MKDFLFISSLLLTTLYQYFHALGTRFQLPIVTLAGAPAVQHKELRAGSRDTRSLVTTVKLLDDRL